jgi:hypothetical protein
VVLLWGGRTAEKDGREGEPDAAPSAFCDEWNLDTPERAVGASSRGAKLSSGLV